MKAVTRGAQNSPVPFLMSNVVLLQKARPPNKRPPEYLILESRKKDDYLKSMQEQRAYNDMCDLKNEWERWTDKKIVLNNVRREVGHHLRNHEFSVEERRERYVVIHIMHYVE